MRMPRVKSRKARTCASSVPHAPEHDKLSVPDSSIQQAPQVQPSSSQMARTISGAASRRSNERDSAPVTPCSITRRWAVRERLNCDGVMPRVGS